MKRDMFVKSVAVGIIILLIGTSIPSGLSGNLTSSLTVDSRNSTSDGSVNKLTSYTINQVQEYKKYKVSSAINYVEQPPPPTSEWDGIYEKYTLISQEADIHYDRESQDGSTNSSNYGMKIKLKDRYFDSYYETHNAFNITASPCFFWFNFPKATNISLMRFYFYDPEGMDYAPAVYEVYNGSAYVATYNITPMVNGQWVRVNFTQDIVRTMNFTLKILRTRGSIDHPDVYTKVVINELELFENTTPQRYTQDTVPLYGGASKFWNGLDWALSLRIDDCWGLSSFPSWWANILPLTAMVYNPSSTVNVTLVDTKHMEVGSHGNNVDHRANYNKDYNWWRPRADAAKSSIETYTSKTSIWSDKCSSFAIPYSVMDPPGGRALLDAGFKRAGSNGGPGWKFRPLGRQNVSIYNVSEPKNQVPMDWILTGVAGYPKVPWDHENTLRFKENHSYANLYGHPPDTLDPNFKLFVENDITGWYCTLGEITSYWWYKERMNVTYNASSNDTEKIFDINVFENDPNIWEVPITFTFNLTDFNWNGNITVKWRNNNTVYTNSLKDISGFSPGVGQHTNQTMREGYRWDVEHQILYISVKLGCMDEPKSIYLSNNGSNYPPNKPTITGPISGVTGVNYQYTVVTTDPQNDTVSYFVDWGDGSNSGWTSPTASGNPVTVTHAWSITGLFTVKVKARNTHALESVWSDPLTIPITLPPTPKLNGTLKGGFGVTFTVTNTGDATADHVNITVDLSGGIILRPKNGHTGEVETSIPAGSQAILEVPVLGLGRTVITGKAVLQGGLTLTVTKNAFVFGPFVLMRKR